MNRTKVREAIVKYITAGNIFSLAYERFYINELIHRLISTIKNNMYGQVIISTITRNTHGQVNTRHH